MSQFYKITFLILLFFSQTALAQTFHPEAKSDLEKDNFWADVTFDSNSTNTVTVFRVWFKASPEKVFPFLTDTNSFPKIHDNYDDAAVLDKSTFDQIVNAKPENVEALKTLIQGKKQPSFTGRQKGGNWTRYEFVSFHFPWPLANRWSVQKVNITESPNKYRYDYKMHVGNFKSLSGYWELVSIEGKPGWSEFRGRYLSDPGIPLPKVVTKAATKKGLKKDVEDIRGLLNR